MGLAERIIAKKISKSKVLKLYDSDPKKAFFIAMDRLIDTIQNQGYASDLREHLKKNHGWIFK